MPELPEVETIKENVKIGLLNKTITNIDIFYERDIKTKLDEFKKLKNVTPISVKRVGKTVVVGLDNLYSLIFHMRMEGKLYFINEVEENPKHTVLTFHLIGGTKMVFVDTRKFAACYLVKTEDMYNEAPLNNIGKDPFEIKDYQELKILLTKSNKPLKEALMDQPLISGIGNIYADEILYASKLSSYQNSATLSDEQYQIVLDNSRAILQKSIELKGSTVHSYHPGVNVSGGFQNLIKVYDHPGKTCEICGHKIEKRYVGGRGTCFCHSCQNICPSIAIVGPIGSGKTKVLDIFKQHGYETLSCDQIVGDLYKNNLLLNATIASKLDISLINGHVNKEDVKAKIIDKKLKRTLESLIHPLVRDIVNEFLNNNSNKLVAVEVPLLYEARMENYFSYVLGVNINPIVQRERLEHRGENPEERLALNPSIKFYKNLNNLDFLIDNSSDEQSLEEKVTNIINKIK